MKKNSNFALIFLIIFFAAIIRTFFISVYKIPTSTMQPTFMPGDFIISSQLSYGFRLPWSEEIWFASSPAVGDLVVCKFKSRPGITYIRRVKALAGETIITAAGTSLAVSQDEIFVSTDNSEIFDDSKEGLVSLKDVESQAKLIWFSYSKESGVRWNRLFQML